jgi:uncharacterized protein (TIGR02001 family)
MMLDLPPPVPAIEITLASRGISKGIAQTTGPQFLARGELAFGAIYVGAYAKNVDSPAAIGEGGPIVGLRTKAAGFDIAASATWKHAINAEPGSDAQALELSGGVSRKFGRVTPRLSVVWSPDDVGSTGRTLFAEAGASVAVAKTFSISAAVGTRERDGGPDYTAWNAGLAWNPVKPLTIELRYYDTNGPDLQPFRARAVAAARLRF